MYRIEVAPGEETVFRTIEELAVGIRNGVVTPRARIYHNASQKWLPIGLHPHYKKALELPAASGSQPATPAPMPQAPRIKPRPEPDARTTGEHRVASAPAATRIPAPVTSPIVAMQQEVLRDLPVVAMPEPLPWKPAPVSVPAPAPASIARIAQAVQAQPTATVTYTPTVSAPAAEAVQTRVEPPPEQPLEQPAPPRPTARRSPRVSGRPLLVLGVAAALVLAAHFALTAKPAAQTDAFDESEPADAVPRADAPEPAVDDVVDPAPAAAATAEADERVSSAPARVPPRVPMVPGPAFAGSAPARPGTDTAALRVTSAAVAPPAVASPPPPSIEPAPAQLDLTVPSLAADSVLPARTGDTTAIKKILRALNGAKPAETPAAP